MSLDDDLDAELASEPDYATVDVIINKNLRALRFTEMDGLAWADLTDKCPARPTAVLDRAYGYNIRLAVALAAPICGEVQDDGEWIKPTEEQWTKLLRSLKGAQMRAVGDALFDLNQWAPTQRVTDAKKALAAESAKSSFSPAVSESPAAN